ncbi:hypothetical protein [Brevibacillus migulae]|uniref:hypothetical protein n=1 Tax=Brevibacillus migulae TaxID=1644114 RepID=UPI00106ECB3A|nr:hypothetical protein [Brevibacillus migulae]
MAEGTKREKEHLAAEILAKGKLDWRFPDENGFSERNLDCFQLCVKEVLQWKREPELMQVFLGSFDCRHSGLLLRRMEPTLQKGWRLNRFGVVQADRIQSIIRSIFDGEGYCLIYYQAFTMPLSRYHQLYEVNHWALVIDVDDTHITIVDETGTSEWFQGSIGRIPWEVFLASWEKMGQGGPAFLTQQDGASFTWDEAFIRLAGDSVRQMTVDGGLDNLKAFVRAVEDAPLPSLIARLDRLEFDIHYFRRLRELWQTAVQKKAIPASFVRSGWVEELTYLCKGWSLVLGVVMKWKKQPERDYRDKLVDYLHQIVSMETSFFKELERMVGEQEAC